MRHKELVKRAESVTERAITYEKILFDTLVSIKELLIKYNVEKLSNGTVVSDALKERAVEGITDEISRITGKLSRLQGPCSTHKMTAYSCLSSTLVSEVSSAIYSFDRSELQSLKVALVDQKNESVVLHNEFTKELLTKNKEIETLHTTIDEMKSQTQALLNKNSSLKSEMDRMFHEHEEIKKNITELRMQGLDFKAEVDSRCTQVLHSVQSVMGFVPLHVQTNIQYLRILHVSSPYNILKHCN